MMQDTKKSDKCQSLELRFSAALKTLEFYTKKNSDWPVLLKIIDLAKSFISPPLDAKLEETDIHEALDVVERLFPIMQRINSEEAKKLESRALKTIHACTKKSQEKKNVHLYNRLERFLKKQNLIENILDAKKIPLCFEKQKNSHPVPKRLEDVFRMKAITLIDRELFQSTSHKLLAIREAPIYSVTRPKKEGEGSYPFTILTLEQQFSPFPGVTVIVTGSFKHDPTALNPTIPLPESFALTTQSEHLGFPDPLQLHGHAFSNAHIPPFPMRPEHFGSLLVLLEKKEALAEAFLNRTSLLEKSRVLCENKVICSQKNKALFLFMHQELSIALFDAAPSSYAIQNASSIVQKFFLWIKAQEIPFTSLARIFRHINHLFVEEPCNFLRAAWTNQNNEELFADHPKKRLDAAKKLIGQRIAIALSEIEHIEKEQQVADYIHLFGIVLGKGSVNIFLQYFSEFLECPPPQLDEFEKKIQSAALNHQQTFFHELEQSAIDYPFERLKEILEYDIALFRTSGQSYPLCAILEKYYTNRYTGKFK